MKLDSDEEKRSVEESGGPRLEGGAKPHEPVRTVPKQTSKGSARSTICPGPLRCSGECKLLCV